MNNLKSYLIALGLIITAAGCNDLDELLVNPNGVDPSEAGAEFLYNNIQIKTAEVLAGAVQNDGTDNATNFTLYDLTGGLSRMSNLDLTGFTYNAAHAPTDFNALWTDIYADLFPDIDAYLAIVEPLGLDGSAGSVKVIRAYMLMLLVDLFGDVPSAAAGQGTDNLNPMPTPGAEVYAQAVQLLMEAEAQLSGENGGNFSDGFDNFYNEDETKWLALAKSLRLRAAVATRLVNEGESASIINGLLSEDGLITENNGNFEYQYGSNRANPSSRHPFYVDSYEENSPQYQSNWYMWLLSESKGFPDPRTRYYFYRQEKDIFPGVVNSDPDAFDCIFTRVPTQDDIPPHYAAVSEDMPYCLGSYSQGYFGRDHLNGSGIPPDEQYRTVFGLYPAGGMYDDDVRFMDVLNGGEDGAQGAGIIPIWQASWTHFQLAEAALTIDGVNADAAELLRDGIALSMDRVRSFESLLDGGEVIATRPREVTLDETFVPDSTVQQYIDFVMENFDNADDDGKLEIIAQEYMIALWGNGQEAYNLYRRTCRPAQIQPAIDQNPGQFIRSFFYPAVHANLNQNVTQKGDDLQETVFWDTNGPGCTY